MAAAPVRAQRAALWVALALCPILVLCSQATTRVWQQTAGIFEQADNLIVDQGLDGPYRFHWEPECLRRLAGFRAAERLPFRHALAADLRGRRVGDGGRSAAHHSHLAAGRGHLENQPRVSAIDCLIAIPCYQESARLPSFLETLCPAVAAAPFTARIVVVDDGSGEPEAARTREIVARAADRWPGLLAEPVLLPANRGKGGAVYAGWESPDAETARLLCFVDADGSVPAAEVIRLVAELLADRAERWQAIFGSRVKLLGSRVERLPSRHYVGRVFATLVTVITGLTIYDSQCGLKVVRRAAYTAIAGELTEHRFVFDVELALRLLRHHFAIREVPIDWTEIAGSKVRLLRDSWRMATGLLRIRGRLRADGNLAPVTNQG